MSRTLPLTPFTLFLTFLKACGLTLGGGYATVQPLQKKLVVENAWMTQDDFAECLTVAQAMPGILTVNLAVYLGKTLNGWRGSVVALLGTLLPPFFVLLVVATFFNDLRSVPGIAGFLRGARPAIVALILLPCLQMWKNWKVTLSTVWIPVGAAIGIGLLGVSPVYIIVGLVFLGLLYGLMVKNA